MLGGKCTYITIFPLLFFPVEALSATAASGDSSLYRMCSRELVNLAVNGVSEENRHDLSLVKSDLAALTSRSIPVMEVLVSVLIKHTREPIKSFATIRHEEPSLAHHYVNLSADTLARLKAGSSVDNKFSSMQQPQEGRLALIDGLAACCFSSKLDGAKRQWAAIELTRVLSDRSQKTLSSKDIQDAYHS